MQKHWYLVAILLFSFQVQAQERFFSAHGDLNFLHLTSKKQERYCEKLPCHQLDSILTQLETDLANDKSDQEIMMALKSATLLKDRDLNKFLKIAQAQGAIDSIQYAILDRAIKDESDETFNLSSYKRKIESIRFQAQLMPTGSEFELLNSKKFSRRIKYLRDTTPRQRLYGLYSPLQISKLAKVIDDNLKVIYSSHATISIDFDGNGQWDREEDLSAGERYRLGLKLLIRDFYRLKNSSVFSKAQPTLIDCLSAALELGIIDREVLSEVMAIQDLDLLPKNFWQRHQHIFKSLLRAGAFALPGVGPYIAVAIIISEAVIEGRSGYEQMSQDHLF